MTAALPLYIPCMRSKGAFISRNSGPGKSSSKLDRKSTRLNSSHQIISYAVFCLKKKKTPLNSNHQTTSYADSCWEKNDRELKDGCVGSIVTQNTDSNSRTRHETASQTRAHNSE